MRHGESNHVDRLGSPVLACLQQRARRTGRIVSPEYRFDADGRPRMAGHFRAVRRRENSPERSLSHAQHGAVGVRGDEVHERLLQRCVHAHSGRAAHRAEPSSHAHLELDPLPRRGHGPAAPGLDHSQMEHERAPTGPGHPAVAIRQDAPARAPRRWVSHDSHRQGPLRHEGHSGRGSEGARLRRADRRPLFGCARKLLRHGQLRVRRRSSFHALESLGHGKVLRPRNLPD